MSPIRISPIPKDIDRAVEYFCLKVFSTTSPKIVMVVLIPDSHPKPAKNNPMEAIKILTEILKMKIPSRVRLHEATMENFLP